jgi:hypothetical protein
LRGIEHLLDVSIERLHHADARVHHEVPTFGCADQAPGRNLPFGGVLVSLWQLHDVVGGSMSFRPSGRYS